MTDNPDELESEIERELQEWLPRPGDKLFVETPGAAALDPLGFSVPGEPRSPIGRWDLYADGFLHAGDRLVENWAGQAYEDELIYPLLALYRQHLELLLKLVIRSAPGFVEETKKWLYNTHELDELWDKLVEVYPDSHGWASKECTEACSQLVKEFAEHDPRSFAARYPIDKQDRQTLERLRAIDVRILRLCVHKVSHYLGTIIESIHQDWEWRSEVASW